MALQIKSGGGFPVATQLIGRYQFGTGLAIKDIIERETGGELTPISTPVTLTSVFSITGGSGVMQLSALILDQVSPVVASGIQYKIVTDGDVVLDDTRDMFDNDSMRCGIGAYAPGVSFSPGQIPWVNSIDILISGDGSNLRHCARYYLT